MTLLKGITKTLVVTAVLFASIEAFLRVAFLIRNSMVEYVPLPYVIGHDYGPIPPWWSDLFILAPDQKLIWRNRPNLHRRYLNLFSPVGKLEDRLSILRSFIPTIPASLKASSTWQVKLNSEGYRNAEIGAANENSFRLVCLGDSWTFGMGVNDDETYPKRLESLLKAQFPDSSVEVWNRGVLAYSSFQGLELLRDKISAWKPNMVVIGFAMNDSKVAGYRDKDFVTYYAKHSGVKQWLESAFEKSAIYNMLKYFALVLKYQPVSIAEHMKAEIKSADADFNELEPWTRVSPADYEKNISEMIRLAIEHGADVVLLYNEFWEDSPYKAALESISKRRQVPIIDTSVLVREAREKMEAELERKLNLVPPTTNQTNPSQEIEVVFRVYAGTFPTKSGIYIFGSDSQLGNYVPNKIAMFDDGTHGDQRAGDAVWSYSAKFAAGTKLLYAYTNSGDTGKWEGLDVPHIRRAFKIPAGKTFYHRPIDSFGKIYMQADGWHTDATGYELVAKSLYEVLIKSAKFKSYLAQVRATSG